MARPYKTGPKDNKELVKRNEALYRFIVDEGHTYREAEQKFDVSVARCYQIVDRMREKNKQQA